MNADIRIKNEDDHKKLIISYGDNFIAMLFEFKNGIWTCNCPNETMIDIQQIIGDKEINKRLATATVPPRDWLPQPEINDDDYKPKQSLVT